MTKPSINRLIERIFAHLFFLFFVFEIFSPQIGHRTLYLEYLFVLSNPYFWKWLFGIRFSRRVLYLMLPAIVMIPFHTVAAIKLVVVFFGVAFLVYCYERQLFKAIKPYLVITVCVALLQFIATVSGNLPIAVSIGPSSLAHMVWGPYGTATNTNFYTIFFFPRVSGLSREAGFFASLLVVSYLAFRVNDRLGHGQLSKRFSLIHLVGYIVSFSKVSIALIPALLIMIFRRLVDRIPLFLIGGAFLGALVIFWYHYRFILIAANSITYIARFGGYAFLYELNVHQLVFGVSDLNSVQGQFAQYLSYAIANSAGFGRLAGLGGWVVENGLLAFFLYTLGLQALGIKGAGFLLILLMTATVGIDTNQNFVLLAYYTALMSSRLPEQSLAWRARPRSATVQPRLATR
jgi:hypothetical protein